MGWLLEIMLLSSESWQVENKIETKIVVYWELAYRVLSAFWLYPTSRIVGRDTSSQTCQTKAQNLGDSTVHVWLVNDKERVGWNGMGLGMGKQDGNQERLPEGQLPSQRLSDPPMTLETSSTLRLAIKTWQNLAFPEASLGSLSACWTVGQICHV